MKDKRLKSALLFFAAVGISSFTSAMSFTETGLATYSTRKPVISGDGTTVVVGSSKWSVVGGVVGLGNVNVKCVSEDGLVVAGNEGYSFGGDGTAFYRYLSESKEHTLRGWIGSLTTDARAINSDGSVIVGWDNPDYSDPQSTREAVRWVGSMASGYVLQQALGALPGGSGYDYSAEGVSLDGSVVVGSGRSSYGYEAFRWTQASGTIGIGDLPGGIFYSRSVGVSGDGTIVVGNGYSANGAEAFRWTQSSGLEGLGDLPGGDFYSVVSAISADGSTIVGKSRSSTGDDPFVWDTDNGMRALKVVLEEGGVDLTGWVLYSATGISSDGSKITGVGRNPSGTTLVFIADLTTLPGEIGVTGAGGPISDDGTANFGNHAVGIKKIRTFRIKNDATGDATSLFDFSITKNGTDAAAFMVGAISAGSLGNGQSTTFRVTFTPTTASAHSAVIHIASNDEDENPFDINLSGVGLANSDSEPGSDAWETANGFAPNIYDFYTLDSDGDGIPDIREIYFGWSRFPSFSSQAFVGTMAMEGAEEGRDFFNVHTSSNGTLKVQYRRSTTQTALIAQPIWTSNLSTNGWKYSGENDLGAVVTVSETVISNGPNFEIIEVSAEPVSGNPDSLFFTLELTPNE